MPLQVGLLMILRGCACTSRKRIFSSSRYSARWVWSRPVCLPSFPGLHRDMAVGLGRELQDDLAGVDVGHDLRHALRHALGQRRAVELPELLDLGAGLPADALAAVAQLVHQGPSAMKRLRRSGSRARPPRSAARSCRGSDRTGPSSTPSRRTAGPVRPAVVHQRRQHHLAFDAQVADADFAEGLRRSPCRSPSRCGFAPPGPPPRTQRVDEGVHVAGVEVVLLVPAGGGQHDVAVKAGGAHAEVQRHHQVELADQAPPRATSLRAWRRRRPGPCPGCRSRCPAGACRSTRGPCPTEPSRLLRQTNITRGQFCGASGVLAAHLDRAVLQRPHDVVPSGPGRRRWRPSPPASGWS